MFTDLSFPLGPAEKYAWPGGYPIGYLVDDSEYLCAQCVNDPTNPVHAGGNADGWRIEGMQILEGSAEDYDGRIACAHCQRVLVAGYVVVENTPGYLPEDDDPATFATLAEARVYASDLLSRLLDTLYDSQMLDEDPPPGFTVHGSFAQEDTSVLVYDNSREHDLGRVIEILEEQTS